MIHVGCWVTSSLSMCINYPLPNFKTYLAKIYLKPQFSHTNYFSGLRYVSENNFEYEDDTKDNFENWGKPSFFYVPFLHIDIIAINVFPKQ